MVLDHIADRASLVVKSSSTLNAKILRHRDLDALHVISVPEGLNKSVGEAECQHIVHGALSEIVVDTKDVGFVEYTEQDPVQFLRRGQIVPKGLLDDDASASTAIGLVQMFHDGFE